MTTHRVGRAALRSLRLSARKKVAVADGEIINTLMLWIQTSKDGLLYGPESWPLHRSCRGVVPLGRTLSSKGMADANPLEGGGQGLRRTSRGRLAPHGAPRSAHPTHPQAPPVHPRPRLPDRIMADKLTCPAPFLPPSMGF